MVKMYLCIKIVDIHPADIICVPMHELDDHWYVASFGDVSEIYVVIDTHVDFIVWRNHSIVRLVRVDIADRNSNLLCIKVDYSFFIDNLAFDMFYELENADRLLDHLLAEVDD